MKTGKQTDAYEMIKLFQQTTLSNKPSFDQMIYEVRLMNFKIRPVSGNIASLDFNNEELIEALWSLGKLDEFCREEVKNVVNKEQDAFFRMVNEMRFNFQQQLNKVRLVQGVEVEEEPPSFEAEIYKDSSTHIN